MSANSAAVAAHELENDYIGIEENPEYIKIEENRLKEHQKGTN